MRRVITVAVASAMALAMFALPAGATVHEITGMFCAGEHAIFAPPGISGRSNANNEVQPLIATGFIIGIVPFDPPGPQEPGLLVEFDFDHPASKLVGLGFYVQIDEAPDGTPIYVEAFDLDPDAGFTHCVELR